MLIPHISIDLATLVPLLLIAFLAGLARGFSGFGSSLIFVPVASALVGPRVAVPLVLIVDMIAPVGMIPGAFERAERRDVLTVAAGGLIGVPLGAVVLTVMDPLALRWSIVVLVGALLVLIVSGWRYRGEPSTASTVGVGVVSGVLSGTAQVGGPPLIAYWLGRSVAPQTVRANMVLYLLISGCLSAMSYLVGGLVTREVLILAVVIIPAFAIATWLGSHLFSRSNEIFFRRACYGLIGIAAILGMPIWG